VWWGMAAGQRTGPCVGVCVGCCHTVSPPSHSSLPCPPIPPPPTNAHPHYHTHHQVWLHDLVPPGLARDPKASRAATAELQSVLRGQAGGRAHLRCTLVDTDCRRAMYGAAFVEGEAEEEADAVAGPRMDRLESRTAELSGRELRKKAMMSGGCAAAMPASPESRARGRGGGQGCLQSSPPCAPRLCPLSARPACAPLQRSASTSGRAAGRTAPASARGATETQPSSWRSWAGSASPHTSPQTRRRTCQQTAPHKRPGLAAPPRRRRRRPGCPSLRARCS
jgi:hypothetical protein